MLILFDKNVPVGARRSLPGHEVHTVVEMGWPNQLENGELLKLAEQSGFDVMVTSDQNIRYQQNLTDRKLALVVLGSNIWPVVRKHSTAITASVDAATPGSYDFIEMPLPPKLENDAMRDCHGITRGPATHYRAPGAPLYDANAISLALSNYDSVKRNRRNWLVDARSSFVIPRLRAFTPPLDAPPHSASEE